MYSSWQWIVFLFRYENVLHVFNKLRKFLLRFSELVNLKRLDICFLDYSLSLFIYKSKMDHYREGSRSLYHAHKKLICPVRMTISQTLVINLINFCLIGLSLAVKVTYVLRGEKCLISYIGTLFWMLSHFMGNLDKSKFGYIVFGPVVLLLWLIKVFVIEYWKKKPTGDGNQIQLKIVM